MWEFSVGLYMISVWPNSLLFAAIYGVVESASTAFFGPVVGDWVDKLAYVKVLLSFCHSKSLSFCSLYIIKRKIKLFFIVLDILICCASLFSASYSESKPILMYKVTYMGRLIRFSSFFSLLEFLNFFLIHLRSYMYRPRLCG